MSRIDYSKWDHLSDSDDDDDDNQERPRAAPRVTKLEQPSRITTLSDGSIQVQPASPTSEAQRTSSLKDSTKPIDDIPSDWTEKGDHVCLDNDMELWWSQDRYSVTIRMALPFAQKLQVHVEGILPYSERYMATGSQRPRLVVRFTDQSLWFEGELPHPVHLAEEDDDTEEIDWTVLTGPQNRRYLTLLLHKATPMAGMFLWWRQPFTHCPEIRLENDDSNAFQQAWNDAQKQFVETIKTRPKHVL